MAVGVVKPSFRINRFDGEHTLQTSRNPFRGNGNKLRSVLPALRFAVRTFTQQFASCSLINNVILMPLPLPGTQAGAPAFSSRGIGIKVSEFKLSEFVFSL
jgi:hypothetical protein